MIVWGNVFEILGNRQLTSTRDFFYNKSKVTNFGTTAIIRITEEEKDKHLTSSFLIMFSSSWIHLILNLHLNFSTVVVLAYPPMLPPSNLRPDCHCSCIQSWPISLVLAPSGLCVLHTPRTFFLSFFLMHLLLSSPFIILVFRIQSNFVK